MAHEEMRWYCSKSETLSGKKELLLYSGQRIKRFKLVNSLLVLKANIGEIFTWFNNIYYI